MALRFHQKRGTVVIVDFDQGFRTPEMVKKRLCVVVSVPIDARVGLCTVVPLSTTPPDPVMDYHYELEIPFRLPSRWGARRRWVKADMIYSVGFHRVDLLRLEKGRDGRRVYQTAPLSNVHMSRITDALLAGLGLPPLTR